MESLEIKIEPYLYEIKEQIKSAKSVMLDKSLEKLDRYHYFLIHCAIIHKILFPVFQKDKGLSKEENKQKEEWLNGRKKELSKYFGNIDEVNVRKFRNHFEHIDERLDDAIKEDRIIVDRNEVWNASLKDVFNFNGLSQIELRNIENENLILCGEKFDLEKARKWLDDIDNLISQKGIPENSRVSSCRDNVIE